MTRSEQCGAPADKDRSGSSVEGYQEHLEEAAKCAAEKRSVDEKEDRKWQAIRSIQKIALFPDPRRGQSARTSWQLECPNRPDHVKDRTFYSFWVIDRWLPSVSSISQVHDILRRIKAFDPRDHVDRAVRTLYFSLLDAGAAMDIDPIVDGLLDIHEKLGLATARLQRYFKLLLAELMQPARQKTGRPLASDVEEDKRLYDERQKDLSMPLADFAKKEGTTKGDANRAFARYRKSRNREKPKTEGI